VPIYGTRFTLALVHKRLEEHGLLDKTDLREVIPGTQTGSRPFEVEFISVTHSTIDCVALAVRTPVGVVIHTGDFKMDQTPDRRPAVRSARVRALRRRKACSHCSATAPTSSGPATRRRSATSARASKN
jgi:mRNA degradation ribonuclease J1/J2